MKARDKRRRRKARLARRPLLEALKREMDRGEQWASRRFDGLLCGPTCSSWELDSHTHERLKASRQQPAVYVGDEVSSFVQFDVAPLPPREGPSAGTFTIVSVERPAQVVVTGDVLRPCGWPGE